MDKKMTTVIFILYLKKKNHRLHNSCIIFRSTLLLRGCHIADLNHSSPGTHKQLYYRPLPSRLMIALEDNIHYLPSLNYFTRNGYGFRHHVNAAFGHTTQNHQKRKERLPIVTSTFVNVTSHSKIKPF